MLKQLFNSQTKTVTSATLILGIAALVSKIFGLVRQGLIAGHFGRGIEADVYFAAFRLPDFIYNILIAGGIAVVFLPLFSQQWKEGKDKAWQLTNHLLNFFLFLLSILCLFLFILAPWLIKLLTPGFSLTAQASTIALTRLMLLSPLFLGISAIFSGVLHYFNRFLVYSLAPILYNLGIIFGILFLSPHFGIFGLGMGVVFGAFLHFLIQAVAIKGCGFSYQFLLNWQHPALKKIFKLMLPPALAVAAQQINLMVVVALASIIGTGAVAIFSYAHDIYYSPIGIVALPYALASFPVFSRFFVDGKKTEFKHHFFEISRNIFFLIIPLTVLIFVLREQVVHLILGSLGPGHFDWVATKLTAAALAVFSLAMAPQSLLPLTSRAFFSLHDTKTPTLITVAAIFLNIFLSFTFVWLLSPLETLSPIGIPGLAPNFFSKFFQKTLGLSGLNNIAIIGLPLAFALSSIFQLILFLHFLEKKIGFVFAQKEPILFLLKILAASFLAGTFSYISLHMLSNLFKTPEWAQITGAGLVGVIVYILASFLFKLPEVSQLNIVKRLAIVKRK